MRAICHVFIFWRLRQLGSGSPPPSQSAPSPPDLHEPPVSSESSWSSSIFYWAILVQFASPEKSLVPSTSFAGTITVPVPTSYLHDAFAVQSGSHEGDVWIADSGVSCHMTHDRDRLYYLRPPPPGHEIITIGGRRKLKVECVGNMDVILHGFTDQRIRLIDVSYAPGLEFNRTHYTPCRRHG